MVILLVLLIIFSEFKWARFLKAEEIELLDERRTAVLRGWNDDKKYIIVMDRGKILRGVVELSVKVHFFSFFFIFFED
jgi:hypothetical protein